MRTNNGACERIFNKTEKRSNFISVKFQEREMSWDVSMTGGQELKHKKGMDDDSWLSSSFLWRENCLGKRNKHQLKLKFDLCPLK